MASHSLSLCPIEGWLLTVTIPSALMRRVPLCTMLCFHCKLNLVICQFPPTASCPLIINRGGWRVLCTSSLMHFFALWCKKGEIMGKLGMQKHARLLPAREPTVLCASTLLQLNADWFFEIFVCLGTWKCCDKTLTFLSWFTKIPFNIVQFRVALFQICKV